MWNNQWKAEIDGSLTSEKDGFRLEIRDVGGMARFLVLRQTEPGTRSRQLVASGSQMNERLAMTAALEMAERLKRSFLLASPVSNDIDATPAPTVKRVQQCFSGTRNSETGFRRRYLE